MKVAILELDSTQTEVEEAPAIAAESVFQPMKDAVKFCGTWQMGLLYGPIIFTGDNLMTVSQVADLYQ